MVSENAVSSGDDGNVANRPSSGKKNQGKIRRKIHKAEREKQKRDHMNVLFLELSKAIEPADQSNGKASILNDTIRLLKEVLAQLDCLKQENAALLSESHYLTLEKIELCEENSALGAQIEKLRGEVEERAHCQSSMNVNISQSQIHATVLQPPEDHFPLPETVNASQVGSVVAPILIVPLQHESQVLAQSDTAEALPSNVRKPRPRYPSASDSWPSHILDRQRNAAENVRQSSGSVSSGTSSDSRSQ